MTKRFSFDYKGMKVKGMADTQSKSIVVADIRFSVGGVSLSAEDLLMSSDRIDKLFANAHKAVKREYKKLVQSGRL